MVKTLGISIFPNLLGVLKRKIYQDSNGQSAGLLSKCDPRFILGFILSFDKIKYDSIYLHPSYVNKRFRLRVCRGRVSETAKLLVFV